MIGRQYSREEKQFLLSNPAPLAMLAFAVPLFVWSAFNAGYLGGIGADNFIIPLAVFFGAPVLLGAAAMAYARHDVFMASLAGAAGSFWISYGLLLWLTQTGVVTGATGPATSDFLTDTRGLLFAVWAISFGIVWLGSMRHHWALGLIALGTTVMYIFLSVGSYSTSSTLVNIGGWIGFITAGVAWYTAVAELLNAEFERTILPTGPNWYEQTVNQ